MALDFPSSPSLNQVFSSGGRNWIWNGSEWLGYNLGVTGPTGYTGYTGFTGFTGPAGATGPQGNVSNFIYRTTNYTAANKEGILADTSGGAFTVTLPAAPSVGSLVVVADAGAAWGTNNLTIGRNGSTISNLAEDLICDISRVSVQLVYDGTTWEVYAQIGGNGGNPINLETGVTGILPIANGGSGLFLWTACS